MNIYLSKSNASNYEVYSLCKKKLLSLGHNVLEFTGGNYSNKELLRADFLFIVPPERIINAPDRDGDDFHYNFQRDSTHYYRLGKGQTEQILDFARKYSKVKTYNTLEYEITCSRIFILTEINYEDNKISLYGDQINSLTLIEEDWKESWSELDIDGSMQYIEGCLNSVEFSLPKTDIPRDDNGSEVTIMLGTIALYPHITL